MVISSRSNTVNGTSAWVPEPNGRGTWSLLSTCIITVLLCVWSAVHLNVPQYEKTHSQYWRKVKWLFLGLFAPELVAFVAWQQRQEAKRICREVSNLYGEQSRHGFGSRLRLYFQYFLNSREHHNTIPSSPKVAVPIRSGWELVHGFYVLMGGFTFARNSASASALPEGLAQATVTPDGLIFLLQHEPEALPDITANQIRDKSKADGLKKTLVCAQALWFCVQCITRLSQSLHVSLLELNTVGHALCTLAIYVFWWEKPLDIEEPTVIRDERLQPIFAYMWMSSRVSAREHCSYDMPHSLQNEFHCIWPFSRPALSTLLTGVPGELHSTAKFDPELLSGVKATDRPTYISVTYRLRRRLQKLFCPRRTVRNTPAGLGVRRTAISHLCPADLRRWTLALKAIQRYDLAEDLRSRHRTATSGGFYIASLNMRVPFVEALLNNNLNPRVELRARNATLSVAETGILPGFTISGALYGGLHLAAWKYPFSSPLEKLLWQIAATSVTSTGIMIGALALVVKTQFARRSLSDMMKILTRRPLEGSSKRATFKAYIAAALSGLCLGVVVPCLPVLWLLYLFSRGYLVAESLKNVAYLPAAAFETPAWPSYFPHIT
ncbi:MAG: hypothetical protein LQ338_004622 [Usnochroma carphineum]|nr:MAG: hypothetical protein LQ338_004622 [Usnochroma carphineum]